MKQYKSDFTLQTETPDNSAFCKSGVIVFAKCVVLTFYQFELQQSSTISCWRIKQAVATYANNGCKIRIAPELSG